MPPDSRLAQSSRCPGQDRQLWPAHRGHVGRLVCLLLLAQRSDVHRACRALQGRSPLDTAFMSCGCNARQSPYNGEE